VSATEVVRLTGDELEVELLPELGARLHRLRAFGTDLLRTPPDPAAHADDPFFWGAYVMAPWTNRASASPMTVAGRIVDLPANFPDGTAIHGQVFLAPWRQTGDGGYAVEREGAGWPWAYSVTADISVTGPLLRLRYRLRNASDAPMPAGIGLHPWWVPPVEVGLAARAVHPRNADIAAEHVEASGSWGMDGGQPRRGLDATWLDLDPAAVRLDWPESGIAATLRMRTDGEGSHVAVATPDQPDAVAVEPVTHLPWALDRRARNLSGGIRLLEPGASLSLELELAASRHR
jgi:aldose 1-epimerase